MIWIHICDMRLGSKIGYPLNSYLKGCYWKNLKKVKVKSLFMPWKHTGGQMYRKVQLSFGNEFSTMRWLHFPNSKNEMICVWNYSTARKPYNINCGVNLRYKTSWNSVHSTQEWNTDPPHHPASTCISTVSAVEDEQNIIHHVHWLEYDCFFPLSLCHTLHIMYFLLHCQN